MGGTSGSSGTGTGKYANVYTPKAQTSADTAFQDLITYLFQNQGANSPAAKYLPAAETFVDKFITNSPYTPEAIASAQTAADYGKNTLFPRTSADSATLSTAGNQVISDAFDPGSKIYNAKLQKVMDASNVSNAMSGIDFSGAGAGGAGGVWANALKPINTFSTLTVVMTANPHRTDLNGERIKRLNMVSTVCGKKLTDRGVI